MRLDCIFKDKKRGSTNLKNRGFNPYVHHYEYEEFDKAQLNKVCRQVLDKELKFVYSKGRLDDAVYWLKIMCALRNRPYTPEEVVLTFYDFLEDDEIPDELKPLLKEKRHNDSYGA